MITHNTKLEKIAEDISYEIWMFKEAYQALCTYKSADFLKNALVESFGIHAFNLYFFFYHSEKEKINKSFNNRKKTDVIAEDFDIKRKCFREERSSKKSLKTVKFKRAY
jgi:hypothetical protein